MKQLAKPSTKLAPISGAISEKQLLRLMGTALRAASAAADSSIDLLESSTAKDMEALDICGDAWIVFFIDGRTALGKLLKRINQALPNRRTRSFRIEGHSGRFDIHLGYTFKRTGRVSGQEIGIHEAANRAALLILEDGLGVEGYVHSYVD